MTPVTQTKVHSETQKGNCFAASLASLLDKPLSEMPEFEEMGTDWSLSFLDWLDSIGMDYTYHHFAPKGFSIANGASSRGILHCVIALDGKLVHDPHPSGDFLRRFATTGPLRR